MNRSNFSFVAKVIGLSAALSALIKYGLPMMLAGSQVVQEPTLGLVVALLLAPSALMGGLFWLRRSSNS
ncbi:hypothetical protein [Phormidium tenue]|uniref:Uncharacterized protein n=1 Tax=Phormidium tenue NIES-30 TaxID=549789 RepID=A0A1U7J8Z5_9CYAN|nr:hypothetical protein [Phormidium tenue]MBD2231083.1 hypothetical protein [Phormidium tenue FACHB-1052]OKH49888.1 hypothetical protein NIES30_04020 [Phormidium tenue NIES-30]